jgi:hypothetical protein
MNAAPRYLIFDSGSNFKEEVITTIKNFGIEPEKPRFAATEKWIDRALGWQLPQRIAGSYSCAE